MSQNDFEVIVIGSGPGGCATASLLQKRGVKTLLIEKNGQLGGKMFSVDKGGYAYDLFPHGQVPIHGNALGQGGAQLQRQPRPATLPPLHLDAPPPKIRAKSSPWPIVAMTGKNTKCCRSVRQWTIQSPSSASGKPARKIRQLRW